MIRTRRTLPAAAGVLLAGALAVSAQPSLKSRTFEFTYTAAVREVPVGVKELEVWLPFPQSNASQEVRQVTITAPGPVSITREPEHGNQAVYFRAENPAAPVEITLHVTATRRENAGERVPLTPDERRRYLAAEPLVPLDGPVRKLAEEATRGKRTEAEKARAIYDRVTGMMKYDKSGEGWGRGDAVWACDAKRGNCTDFHSLILGMARSQGIPARFGMGVPLPAKRGEGEVPGYHCWAEMHVAGRGWVPVDSSEAAKALAQGDPAKKDYFFGRHDENRLEFSRGRHLTLSPPPASGPLNFFIYPLVEIDGKKHEAVERKFRFRDLE